MNPAALILLVALAAMCALLIWLPFENRRRRAPGAGAAGDPELAAELEGLLVRKDGLYAAIKDLDFDYQTGKLSVDDYETLKEAYARDAIEVLKEIDERDGDLREGPAKAKRPRRRKSAKGQQVSVLCSECGEELDGSDRFCKHCGATHVLACTECGAEYDLGKQFCSGCGAQLSIGDVRPA